MMTFYKAIKLKQEGHLIYLKAMQYFLEQASHTGGEFRKITIFVLAW